MGAEAGKLGVLLGSYKHGLLMAQSMHAHARHQNPCKAHWTPMHLNEASASASDEIVKLCAQCPLNFMNRNKHACGVLKGEVMCEVSSDKVRNANNLAAAQAAERSACCVHQHGQACQ